MNALVQQARSYIGTPYRHRGRSRRGIDCAGLPWCSYADLGLPLPDLKVYGREPHKDGLMRALIEALGEPVWRGRNPAAAMLKPGDVACSAFVQEPHHLAVIGDDPIHGLSLIHADGMQAKAVIEQPINDVLRSRIVAIFRRPV